MANLKVAKRYRLIEINNQQDLEDALTKIWPSKSIPADDLYGILQKVDIAIIKSDLGVNRRFYTPSELAKYLWLRSNYYAQETKDRLGYGE